MFSRLGAFSILLTALCLVTGCGPAKPRTVSGKVVLLPNSKFADTDVVNLEFKPEKEGEGIYTVADVGKDGSFTIKIPPGKYKVGFMVKPYPGEKDSERRAEMLKTKYDAFAVGKSSMSYEVTSDENQTITVDLAQGRVSK